MTIKLILYLSVSAVVLGALFIYWLNITIANWKHIAPPVQSWRGLRRAVADRIAGDFPDAKTIIDIGSGWGTMARTVAGRFPNACVTGIEIMPMPWLYAKARGLFFKNLRFIFGDAFKFLGDCDARFDVGITYLLPAEMGRVREFLPKFRMLLVLDFPLPDDVRPVRRIKLHRDLLGQHWLYVYKNDPFVNGDR